MRKDKFKLQRGDVLYQASVSYRQVIEWEIVDIFVEQYISGFKTMFVVKSDLFGQATKFLGDIVQWYEIPEAAEEVLREKLGGKE